MYLNIDDIVKSCFVIVMTYELHALNVPDLKKHIASSLRLHSKRLVVVYIRF